MLGRILGLQLLRVLAQSGGEAVDHVNQVHVAPTNTGRNRTPHNEAKPFLTCSVGWRKLALGDRASDLRRFGTDWHRFTHQETPGDRSNLPGFTRDASYPSSLDGYGFAEINTDFLLITPQDVAAN